MKKHSRQEILLKLDEAAELERGGRSQVEVCKALGVSVMTFHRWRKLPMVAKTRLDAPAIVPEQQSGAEPVNLAEMVRLVEELTVENRRLRKIVTDLLLGKIKLEEAAAPLPIGATAKAMAGGVYPGNVVSCHRGPIKTRTSDSTYRGDRRPAWLGKLVAKAVFRASLASRVASSPAESTRWVRMLFGALLAGAATASASPVIKSEKARCSPIILPFKSVS